MIYGDIYMNNIEGVVHFSFCKIPLYLNEFFIVNKNNDNNNF